METYINSLPNESQETFIIQTIWTTYDITINLLNTENVGFTGTISIETLKLTAHELEIPPSDFIAENKLALTSGLPNFIYQFDHINNTFCWCKIQDLEIKIIYGSIKLSTSPKLCSYLLLASIENTKKLDESLNTIKKEFTEFKKDHQQFRKAFEMLNEEKNNLEINLLSRFTQVLDAKKSKIRELKNEIKALKDGDGRASNFSSQETNDTDSQSQKSQFGQINDTASAILAKRKKRLISDDEIEENQPCCSKSLISKNQSNNESKMTTADESAFDRDTQELFNEM